MFVVCTNSIDTIWVVVVEYCCTDGGILVLNRTIRITGYTRSQDLEFTLNSPEEYLFMTQILKEGATYIKLYMCTNLLIISLTGPYNYGQGSGTLNSYELAPRKFSAHPDDGFHFGQYFLKVGGFE